VLATIAACNGCGACTKVCLHEVPVMESLVAVRAEILQEKPALASRVPEVTTTMPASFLGLGARSRYEERPSVSLVPGPGALPDAVQMLFSLCDRLDVDALACGELARLDPGYDLWFSGSHAAFVEQARRVHAAAAGARDIVVMSAETLFLLKHVYPRFGFALGADVMHVSEMLLPLLSGAVVRRLGGRVGYHESCHLARHLGHVDVPRQVLRRVLEGPLHELPRRAEISGCCGGSGRHGARTSTTEIMADTALEAAAEAGLDRLVSFSTECVAAFRGAHARSVARGLGQSPRVDHAVSLVAEAVVGDGSAG
jgi:Fe-S oxidoreductase